MILQLFRKFLVIIGLMIIIGVSTNLVYHYTAPTNEELVPYKQLFELMYGIKVDYSIHFYEPINDTEILGYCMSVHGKPMYVGIDRKQWRWMSELERLLVMFHEMGHCSLKLPHNDAEFEDGCPVYLMHSRLMEEECAKKRGIEYYLSTLKHQAEH